MGSTGESKECSALLIEFYSAVWVVGAWILILLSIMFFGGKKIS